MKSEIKRNLTRTDIWWRALAMILYTFLYGIAEIVLVAVVLFQFCYTLILRESNHRLLTFGQGLSTYVYQILQFLTFNTENLPFPLSAWPAGPPAEPENQGRTAA